MDGISNSKPALIADTVRYVKVSIWTRRDSDGETYEVYKLPDGTEYRGNLYARIDGSGSADATE